MLFSLIKSKQICIVAKEYLADIFARYSLNKFARCSIENSIRGTKWKLKRMIFWK
jgi:hypothetical protein